MKPNWNDLFRYESESGNLYWNPQPIESFPTKRSWSLWNGILNGKKAGCEITQKGGERVTRITYKEKKYRAHVVIWEMHNGPVPDGFVLDHIDRNPHNNRLNNLRLVTLSQNAINASLRNRNTSRHRGVILTQGRWRAYITANGKKYTLGTFDTKEEAVLARQEGAKLHHGEYAGE